MNKIRIMISSTVSDLKAERDAVKKAFYNYDFVELLGSDEFSDKTIPQHAFSETIDLAISCDLYILIMGKRYGWELPHEGLSATELEFNEAYKADPTKVLVFEKQTDECEEKQIEFKSRVSDYFSGYWVLKFNYSHELMQNVKTSFISWLKDRASIGVQTTYIEHFIRIAIAIKPDPHSQVYYRVTKDDIELDYDGFRFYQILFKREAVYKDFWGSISELRSKLKKLSE